MAEKLACRKQAVQLYYYQHLTKAEICRRLGRSRPWLDRWLARYDPDDVAGSLSDRKAGPKQAKGKTKEIMPQSGNPQIVRKRQTERLLLSSDFNNRQPTSNGDQRDSLIL